MGDSDVPRNAADESFSAAGTATENTPLLQSETASTVTAGDGPQAEGQALDANEPSEPKLGLRQTLCLILSMWALIFLQASNMSGMTMTQSVIAEELDAYENAMWFSSSYMITAASIAPLVGRFSMIFSPGSMLLISAGCFSVGSIIASQAHTFATFIFGRVIVGIGGGGILTLSQVLVIQLTSKRRRGLFIGLTNAGFTIGLSTGAIVFGALLGTIGWRALFLSQFPIGVLAGIGVYFSVPSFTMHASSKGKTTLQKLAGIDYLGAFMMTLSIVLFLYSLASNTIQVIPLVLSVLCLAGFVTVEYRVATDPIIPLVVLQNRGILLSCLSQLGFMGARWTVLYFAPIFVLAVRGLGPALAGTVLVATNAGFGTGGLLVGWLHVRRSGSFWLPCLVSLAFFGLTLFGVSFVSNAAAPAWLYLTLLFLNGFCTGAALNYTLAHLLHLAPHDMHFVATGLLGTFRGFAGSFGTAIGGGVFMRTLGAALTEGLEALDGTDQLSPARRELVKRLIGSPALVFGGGLSDAERMVAVAGYELSLRVLYRSAAAMCILVLVSQACTGWSEPVSEEEEAEIEEAIAEHDGATEA